MQDWFNVQSAYYGRYDINVEINGYDVYKVSMSYYNTDTNMVDYPTDETVTGNRAYAKRRYKQLMKKAEEDDYGWNYGIDNPTWEFTTNTVLESVKPYILASTQKSSLGEQADEIARTIEDLFNQNDIYAEFINLEIHKHPRQPSCSIYFEISGDWKHDHDNADDLVIERFGSRLFGATQHDVQDSDSDWYTSTHRYNIFLNKV